MILGEKSRFAIEFELVKEYGGVWIYGKFCYWINNKRIGDYEIGTSLRDIIMQMTSIVKDNGNRSNAALFSVTKEEIYNRLNYALHGCNE